MAVSSMDHTTARVGTCKTLSTQIYVMRLLPAVLLLCVCTEMGRSQSISRRATDPACLVCGARGGRCSISCRRSERANRFVNRCAIQVLAATPHLASYVRAAPLRSPAATAGPTRVCVRPSQALPLRQAPVQVPVRRLRQVAVASICRFFSRTGAVIRNPIPHQAAVAIVTIFI